MARLYTGLEARDSGDPPESARKQFGWTSSARGKPGGGTLQVIRAEQRLFNYIGLSQVMPIG